MSKSSILNSIRLLKAEIRSAHHSDLIACEEELCALAEEVISKFEVL